MPVKHHVLAIVLFWLGTMSWAFHRDVWPWLRPGEPPPFAIDLADEAGTQQAGIRWDVYMNDKEKGYANTGVSYNRGADLYELTCTFRLWLADVRKGTANADLSSTYRV